MKNALKEKMKEAMKAKDKLLLETIRSLLSAIQYEEMNKKTDSLSDAAVLKVIQAEKKKLCESLDYAKQDNRDELIAEATARISCVDQFLPKQMDENELSQIISKFIGENPDVQMGQVMGYLKKEHSGTFDGKLASTLTKAALSA